MAMVIIFYHGYNFLIPPKMGSAHLPTGISRERDQHTAEAINTQFYINLYYNL